VDFGVARSSWVCGSDQSLHILHNGQTVFGTKVALYDRFLVFTVNRGRMVENIPTPSIWVRQHGPRQFLSTKSVEMQFVQRRAETASSA
jgi:hypothetical protein